MNNYFVVNLERVTIEKGHPYTLVFKGYIPTYGDNNRLYTFKYDGDIQYTNASMADDIQKDFANQLQSDYGYGNIFDMKRVKKQLKEKSQYRMKIN